MGVLGQVELMPRLLACIHVRMEGPALCLGRENVVQDFYYFSSRKRKHV